jgi:hypothetical protein
MQLLTPSGGVIEGDPTLACIKVAPRPSEGDGYYFMSGRTGLLAQPAAGAYLMSTYWSHPTKLLMVDLLRVRGMFTTPPTAAQEWALEASVIRGINSAGSASNATSWGGGFLPRKRIAYPVSNFIPSFGALTDSSFVVANTANGITAPSPGVLDASPFMQDMAWELAAGAAVPRSRIEMAKDWSQGMDNPPFLKFGEGIRIANTVLIGAAGVLRVSFEFAWHEVDPSEV